MRKIFTSGIVGESALKLRNTAAQPSFDSFSNALPGLFVSFLANSSFALPEILTKVFQKKWPNSSAFIVSSLTAFVFLPLHLPSYYTSLKFFTSLSYIRFNTQCTVIMKQTNMNGIHFKFFVGTIFRKKTGKGISKFCQKFLGFQNQISFSCYTVKTKMSA